MPPKSNRNLRWTLSTRHFHTVLINPVMHQTRNQKINLVASLMKNHKISPVTNQTRN